MALPEDKVLEEEDDFLDTAGDVLAAPFRGVEGAVQGAYNLADYVAFDVLPDYDTRFLGTSKTMAGGAVEGITQFATGFVPLFGLAGRAGALAKAGKATQAVVAGAATDFTFFNGQEARLSNLIQQVPELQNPVTEFLAYDGDENELVGRMKNVLEGLGLEAVAGVFIKSLKGIKEGRKAKGEGKDAVGQAQATVEPLEGGRVFVADEGRLAGARESDEFDEMFREVGGDPEDIPEIDLSKVNWDEVDLEDVAEVAPRLSREELETLEAGGKLISEQTTSTGIVKTYEMPSGSKRTVMVDVNDPERVIAADLAFAPKMAADLDATYGNISSGLKKDFYDKTLVEEVSNRMQTGKPMTAREAIQDLADRTNGNLGEYSPVVKRLLALGKETGIDARIEERSFASNLPEAISKIRGSFYDSAGRRIVLDAQDSSVKNNPVYNLLHESTHAVTVDNVSKHYDRDAFGNIELEDVAGRSAFIDNVLKQKDLPKPIAEMFRMFKKADGMRDEIASKGKLVNTKGESDLYWVKNPMEFMSMAFSDPQLQKALKGIQYTPKMTMWEKVVNTVKSFFGKGVSTDLADNIVSRVGDIAEMKLPGRKGKGVEGMPSGGEARGVPEFNPKKPNEFLQSIPEKFRGYAEELIKGGKPRLPRFALETSDDVIELKDLLESYYKENPNKINVEGDVLELDAEIEKSLMLQEGKDAATKVAEARIVQQSIRDQGVAVVSNLTDSVAAFKKAGGGDVAIADIKNNFQQLLSIADVYRKLGRQGSLLLGSRREGFASSKIGLNEADFKIDGLRKQFANASGMDPQKMVDLIDEHIDPTDPVGSLERLFKTAKKAQGKSMLDMPIEYWMNAILSGPKTQVVNAMGNSITQVMTSIEAVLGGVASGNMDVVKAVFASWADGKMYSEAAGFAKKAFKQSDNVLDPNSRAFSDRPDVAISGQRVSEAMPGQGLSQSTEKGIDWFANNVIRIPSRLLMTTDEFFKQLAYRRAARLKAAMSGLQQGIREPNALAEHINKTLEGVITEGGRMGSEEGLAREAYDIFKNKSEFKPEIDELDALENKKSRSDLSEADTKRLRALKQKVGKDRNKFVGDYVQNNFDDTKSALIQYAQDEARYLTFTNELEPGLGKGLQNITNNIPAARLILPFVRTPTNILTFALERTPLNIPLTKESWERFKLELRNPDPIVKAQARGKLATAALVGYTLMDAVQNGNGAITGGGPSDERQKKALQAAGWQPYSIKIDNEYYSYQRLDPIATPLGIIADIVETGVTESKDFDESGLEHATQSFLLALTRNVTNKSYLAGIQTFTDALSDPDRFVPRFGRNFVSSFVPNLISQMADSDTQVMKESRSVMDAVKKKLGDRNGLDSKRNVLGEEITMETMLDSPLQFLNPIAFSTKKDDPVLQEMAGLNHAFRLPPPSLGGQIDMLAYKKESGQSAYDRWQELLKSTKIGGQSLRQALTRLVKSKDYKKMSPESEPGLESPRITQINSVLTKYRKEARKRMLREFPELSNQYSALTLAKTRFKTGVSREDVLALLSQ